MMLEHGIRLELAVNELSKAERHTLHALTDQCKVILRMTKVQGTETQGGITIGLDSLFRITRFNSTKELYNVLTELRDKGFIELLDKTNNSLVANIKVHADSEQLATLDMLEKTETLENLMDNIPEAARVMKTAQAKLDSRILPLLDHPDADTHVLNVWPTQDREGWMTIRLSHYYDEIVEFPTAVVNASDPVAALKEYDHQLFEKYGHHLNKPTNSKPKI